MVYKGDCSCGDSCIGETKRNVQVRIQEHFNAEPTPVTYVKIRRILLASVDSARHDPFTNAEFLKA